MERDAETSDEMHLVYREEGYPVVGLPILVLSGFVALGMLSTVVLNWERQHFLSRETFLLVVSGLVAFPALLLGGLHLCRGRVLAFNRHLRQITSTTTFPFWSRSQTYRFDDFDTLLWGAVINSPGAKYRIELRGPQSSLQLGEKSSQFLTLDLVEELSEYLAVSQQQQLMHRHFRPARLAWLLLLLPVSLIGFEAQYGELPNHMTERIGERLIFPGMGSSPAAIKASLIDSNYEEVLTTRTYVLGLYSTHSRVRLRDPRPVAPRMTASTVPRPDSIPPEARRIPSTFSNPRLPPEARATQLAQQQSMVPLEIVPVGDTLAIDIDEQFTYVPDGFPLGLGIQGNYEAEGLQERPFETLEGEPDYGTEEVSYGSLPMGNSTDSRYSFAVAVRENKWYLYFDSNNNEDLTDDGPPLENRGTGKLGTTISLKVEVVSDDGSIRSRPYRVWFWITESRQPYFYSRCHYRRTLTIDGQNYVSVSFEQSNCDGMYRDAGLWLDINQNGRIKNESEHFNAGDLIEIGGKSYRLLLDYP